MKVKGIRFCSVSKQAQELAHFLKDGLGLPIRAFTEGASGEACPTDFQGMVFPAGEEGESWVEIWPDGPEMPEGIMLQVVVDDADTWARRAKNNGLEPHGPVDAHGERIYYLKAPGGLSMSFQSKATES